MRALATVLRYILEVHAALDVDELKNIAEHFLRGAGAPIMATAQELIDRARRTVIETERPS